MEATLQTTTYSKLLRSPLSAPKNAQPFKLELPKKLETKKELIDFSNKINSHITFDFIFILKTYVFKNRLILKKNFNLYFYFF